MPDNTYINTVSLSLTTGTSTGTTETNGTTGFVGTELILIALSD